jgi:hypothetical protein
MISSFLHRFRWFRRLHGGRWELWHIGICNADIWLRIDASEPDNRYQPCSIGPRMAREDYP